MTKAAYFLILLLSVSFAWDAGNEPPSCLTTYPVLGQDFYVTQANTAYGCQASTGFYRNFGWNSTIGGIAADIKIISNNATHIELSTSSQYLFIPLPNSGNYTIRSNGQGAGQVRVMCAVNPSLELDIAANTYANLVDFNSTTYQINRSTEPRLNCSKSERIYFYTTFGTRIAYPIYNITAGTESNFSGFLGGNLTTGYMSYYQGEVVRSNFRTGNISFPATAGYCRALLYFNNPYYGNIQLAPRITYIPSVDAMPNFINSSDNSAYIPNNTITYVYDRITSAWYIVPASICSSFTQVLTVATLQYNPTSINGNNTVGQIPIENGDLSGSCTINAATRVITCTAADSSNTLTTINLTVYQIANQSVACANGTAGSSATLTCSLSQSVNTTYTAYVYGQDANQFYHYIYSQQFIVGVLSGVSSYGRDAYLAILFLVGLGATIVTGSIAVSMVLATLGFFFAALLGIVSIPMALTVGIMLVAIALVLSYRLRV